MQEEKRVGNISAAAAANLSAANISNTGSTDSTNTTNIATSPNPNSASITAATSQSNPNPAASTPPQTPAERIQQSIISYFLPQLIDDAISANQAARHAPLFPEDRTRLTAIVEAEHQKALAKLHLNPQGELPQGVKLPPLPTTPEQLHEIELNQNTQFLLSQLKNPDPAFCRNLFLDSLRHDRISSQMEEKYLLTLPSQLSRIGARQIFEQIIPHIREKQILAIVTGYNATNWQDVTYIDIEKFLNKPHRRMPDYRTPVGFARLRHDFLSELQPLASPEQFDSYIHSMNHLESKLYGQRFDYYRQFELLRKEAQSIGQDVDSTLLEDTAPEPTTKNSTRAARHDDAGIAQISPVSAELRDQLLSHAVIEGDLWHQNGQAYRLSIPNLTAINLIPSYELKLDNITIYLSNLFVLSNDQMAALAFIPTATGVKVRGYYRDKNFAIWHYLPDYVKNLSGEGIESFGTGFNPHSVILPFPIQAALAQIEQHRSIVHLVDLNPDFILAGTAFAYANQHEYRDAFSRGQLRGDFYREVASRAYNADSSAVIMPGRRKVAPQLVSVNQNVEPNFSQLLSRYSVYSAFAGQIMGETYASHDRQTFWLMFSDYRARCWVGNIEMQSPITTTGCRQEWLLPTDIATPLYELSSLSDGYGDPADTRAGNYISMWNNYLSRISLIEDYATIVTKNS